MRKIRTVLPLAMLIALVGCGGSAGTLGDLLGSVLGGAGGAGGGGTGELLVEIQGVDTRGAIAVRTQEGETGNVLFDQNTRVVYQNQEYPVTALERGDVATMRVQQTSDGALYTDLVVVEQSVQERTGSTSGGQQQLTGTVGGVDAADGQFELRTQQGTVVISLPYNAPRSTVDRVRSLRTGEYVRLQGTFVSQTRFELTQFLAVQ